MEKTSRALTFATLSGVIHSPSPSSSDAGSSSKSGESGVSLSGAGISVKPSCSDMERDERSGAGESLASGSPCASSSSSPTISSDSEAFPDSGPSMVGSSIVSDDAKGSSTSAARGGLGAHAGYGDFSLFYTPSVLLGSHCGFFSISRAGRF